MAIETPEVSTGYCFYNGEFNSDDFDTFLKEFKEVQENHNLIQVFIETPGGNLDIAFNLATLFSTCDVRVVVNVASECSSSGFALLALVKDKKNVRINISPTAWATVHLADITASLKEKDRDKSFHNFLEKKLAMINRLLYSIYGDMDFTDKELSDIRKFKDVFLDGMDMCRVFGCNNV